MSRQIIFTPEAAKPPATYSRAVKAAGLISVSLNEEWLKWFPSRQSLEGHVRRG
jgi:hypothetical protein